MSAGCAFSPGEYERNILRTVPFYRNMLSLTAALAKASANGAVRWLDVGCGSGALGEIILNDSTVTLERLVMCDISDEMLNIARNRLEKIGEKTELVKRSALELDYNSEFNVVTSVMVSHYFSAEERKLAAENCYTALEAGGIFIVFENTAPENSENEKLFLNMWKSFQLSQGRSEEAVNAHLKRYNREYFPITAKEHTALLESCGFRRVETVWTSYMQAGFMGIK